MRTVVMSILCVALVGCGDGKEPAVTTDPSNFTGVGPDPGSAGQDDTAAPSSTGVTPTSTGIGGPTSEPDETTTTTTSGPGVTDTTATGGETTTTGVTTNETSSPVCPDPGDLPQDSTCDDVEGCQCASGRCFLVPILGGYCSECLVDADCPDGGCTVPDVFGGGGAVCNQGEMGGGCETSNACDGGVCGLIADVPGILTVKTCGECSDDGDCAGGDLCTPTYALPKFSGTLKCEPAGSVADGKGCNTDAVCQSGHCGEASLQGLFKFGVCGQCNSDADCAGNETCTSAMFDADSLKLIPAVCE